MAVGFATSVFAGGAVVPVTVAEPITVGSLAIYPLLGREPASTSRVVPLSKALRSGEFQVVDGHWADNELVTSDEFWRTGRGYAPFAGGWIEAGGPSDATQGGGAVELRNRMTSPVLVLAGEVMGGAGQDRMLSRDEVVEPGHPVFQPVFCVEHGRGSGDSVRFKGVAGMADSSLRLRGTRWVDQEEVWHWVAEATRRLHSASRTGTYVAILDGSGKYRPSKYWEAAVPQLKARGVAPRMVGFAVAVLGRLVSADTFQTPALFRDYSRELFEAAFVDAELAGDASPKTLTADEVTAQLVAASDVEGRRDFPSGPSDRALHVDTLAFKGQPLHTRYLPR